MSMQMTCWGCPGLCTCLTPGALNIESLKWWYKPCRRPPLRAPQVHWSIQLQSACHRPHGGLSTGHLYDGQRLAMGPTGRPHPRPCDCKDAGWDLGPVPIQANWLTGALTTSLGMQPPQAEAGHPVQKSSTKRVPGGTLSVGVASSAWGDCSGRMPWQDWPIRSQKNAWPDAWPFPLAPNGCTDKEACHKIPSVHHLQGRAAEGSHGKYCSYPSPGASADQLSVPGARERKGGEHPGDDWPLYPVHQGICYSIADGSDNGQGIVEQFHCPLGSAGKDPFRPREKLWEWSNCWPLQVDWYQEA